MTARHLSKRDDIAHDATPRHHLNLDAHYKAVSPRNPLYVFFFFFFSKEARSVCVTSRMFLNEAVCGVDGLDANSHVGRVGHQERSNWPGEGRRVDMPGR